MTTLLFIRRIQVAARRLAAAGFTVVVFGDENHREVQGMLRYAGEKGLATTKYFGENHENTRSKHDL